MDIHIIIIIITINYNTVHVPSHVRIICTDIEYEHAINEFRYNQMSHYDVLLS